MKDLIPAVPEGARIERIERFQSLQPGRYWRAEEDIEKEHISKGMVLLLQSLRYVDDIPHTVVLRAHPSLIGTDIKIWVSKDSYRYGTLQEHRFLVEDFLRLFRYEPDAQRIRAEEVGSVQRKIAALQNELLDVQGNADKLQALALAALAKDAEQSVDKISHDKAGPQDASTNFVGQADSGAQVLALSEVSLSDALQSSLTEEALGSLSALAEREYKLATFKASWIKDKTAEISDTLQQLTTYFEEQAAAALAQTEDTRAYVDELKKGIESLDLYIGKGVEVQTICQGKSAPSGVPLTLVQKKLLMDQELALWTDIDETFDFEDESLFFDTLRTNRHLVEQVFPSERCVLLMAVTARAIEYKDPWEQMAKSAENKKVFLLVRNGENIHRVFSPVEAHLGSARLFPSADEQDAIFRGLDGRSIKFKDIAYTDRLSLHEKHALHYKRFLILLAGLDHRLKLFGDFYPRKVAFDFVSMEFQQKYFHFLFDDDKHVLGENRLLLKDWLREKNNYLKSGSRVLCCWRNLLDEHTASSTGSLYNTSRDGKRFYLRYKPKNSFDVCKVQLSAGDLVTSIEVFGETAKYFADRSFKAKVNLSKFQEDYGEALAYLCLDAVTPEEIAWYLNNRQSRSDHLLYIRFFKRALEALTQEREEEREARDALLEALLSFGITDKREATRLIDKLAIAWRAARQGAPLPSPADKDATDWSALVDQTRALAGGGEMLVNKVELLCANKGFKPLRLALEGKGKYVLYVDPAEIEQDNRLVAHAWVHRAILRVDEKDVSFASKRWAIFDRHVAAETTLHEWAEAKDWFDRAVLFKTPAEKTKQFDFVESYLSKLSLLEQPLSETAFEEHLRAWASARNEGTMASRTVVNPVYALAIGLGVSKHDNVTGYLCLTVQKAHTLLYKLASTRAQKDKVKATYCAAYYNKKAAEERFDSNIKQELDFELEFVSTMLEKRSLCGFFSPGKLVKGRRLHTESSADPRISTKLSDVVNRYKDYDFWFPQPLAALGSQVDLSLGLKLPDNYAPCQLVQVQLYKKKHETDTAYTHWFDLVPADESLGSYTAVEGRAYSSSLTPVANREEALKKMAQIVAGELGQGYTLKAAEECPGAPEVVSGVQERWFVVKVQTG